MKHISFLKSLLHKTVATAVCLSTVHVAIGAGLDSKIDDFSHATQNSLGYPRQFLDDKTAGGKTQTRHQIKKGVLSAKGDIAPPRGQPGWASIVLLLDPLGLPQDASAYRGIRLRIRVNQGNISVSANSSEIQNFDYHAATIPARSGGKFQDVKIPFRKMKRAWSAQTKLNTKTLSSISLVAFGVQKGRFDFEVDEIAFY